MKQIFLFPIRLILFFPLLGIHVFYYPILNILYQNKQLKSKIDLTKDEEILLNSCYQKYLELFNVSIEYKDELFALFDYFASFDNQVIFDPKNQQLCPIGLQYILNILTLAAQAKTELSKVNKDNKKISYYESSSTVNDLVKLYNDKLDAVNEHAVILRSSRNELKLRRWLTKLKNKKSLFFNMYMTVLALFPLVKSRDKKGEDNLLFEDVYSFYNVGHATKAQIHKSIAIQIYQLYRIHTQTKIEILQKNIGSLIDLTMHTDKAFDNFNRIEEKPYIKNVVKAFPVFSSDNLQSDIQMKSFRLFILSKSKYFPWWYLRYFRKLMFYKYISSPLEMYRKMAVLTFFGFCSKKK